MSFLLLLALAITLVLATNAAIDDTRTTCSIPSGDEQDSGPNNATRNATDMPSAPTEPQQPQQHEFDHGQAIINWVRSKGGFVSEKVHVRRRNISDVTSPYGMFATQDLVEDEIVMKIPRHLYLGLRDEEVVGTDLYDREDVPLHVVMDAYYANTCRLAHTLLQHWEAYNYTRHPANPSAPSSHLNHATKKTSAESWESPPHDDPAYYGPYLDYLETQPMGAIPAVYTPIAKQVLRDLLYIGTEMSLHPSCRKGNTNNHHNNSYSLPPFQLVDWMDEHFIKTGCILDSNNNEEQSLLEQHAVALVIQRGFDSELIPLWDMVNHDNRQLNLQTNALRDSPEGLVVWADFAIPAGNELFATYNYCTDCFDVGDDWGTSGIYRDFGFVEGYPHLWPIWEEHQVDFKIKLLEKDGVPSKPVAVFFHPPTTNDDSDSSDDDDDNTHNNMDRPLLVPDECGLAFMREQWERLSNFDVLDHIQQLEATLTYQDKIRPHELDMIGQYRQAIVVAFEAAIDATLEHRKRQQEQPNAETGVHEEL